MNRHMRVAVSLLSEALDLDHPALDFWLRLEGLEDGTTLEAGMMHGETRVVTSTGAKKRTAA